MSSRSSTKINSLLQQWPAGTVATQTWLDRQGISRQLMDKYVQSGWVQRIHPGAYARTGDTVDWLGGVYALQSCESVAIHPGGSTALSLLGLGHHIGYGNERVWLFSPAQTHLPRWFSKHRWATSIEHVSTGLFGEDPVGLVSRNFGNFSVTLSGQERAMFELLYHVPRTFGVEYAMSHMAALSTARPGLVQRLLACCSSVKVKRLFLLMAHQHQHSWVEKVDESAVDLGRGKRLLGAGGYYYPSYMISLDEPLEQRTAFDDGEL